MDINKITMAKLNKTIINPTKKQVAEILHNNISDYNCTKTLKDLGIDVFEGLRKEQHAQMNDSILKRALDCYARIVNIEP